LVFSQYAEEVTEEFYDLIESAVANGVAKVVNEIDFK